MTRFLRPWVAALLLLCGVTAERYASQPPRSAVTYHERVKQIAATVPPLQFGSWTGKDQAVEQASIKMLRPNVILSRSYHNLSTGMDVGFLFVQCPDTVAIMDHYPPICYVNQGYNKDAAVPHDWAVDGVTYTGTEYAFTLQSFTRPSAVVIDNFIVMPDGRIARDMDAARQASNDRGQRFWGAGQVQLIFDQSTTAAERDVAFRELISAARPLIDAVRRGEK